MTALATPTSKALYVAIFMFFLAFKLPAWVFIELSPQRRPRRSWDMKRSMFVRLFKHAATELALDLGIGIGGNGRNPRIEPPEHEQKEARFVFVEGFPTDLVKGELKEYVTRAEVAPERIGAYWFGRRGKKGGPIPPPGENEKVSSFIPRSLGPLILALLFDR
jgi:hypothetical protein